MHTWPSSGGLFFFFLTLLSLRRRKRGTTVGRRRLRWQKNLNKIWQNINQKNPKFAIITHKSRSKLVKKISFLEWVLLKEIWNSFLAALHIKFFSQLYVVRTHYPRHQRLCFKISFIVQPLDGHFLFR